MLDRDLTPIEESVQGFAVHYALHGEGQHCPCLQHRLAVPEIEFVACVDHPFRIGAGRGHHFRDIRLHLIDRSELHRGERAAPRDTTLGCGTCGVPPGRQGRRLRRSWFEYAGQELCVDRVQAFNAVVKPRAVRFAQTHAQPRLRPLQTSQVRLVQLRDLLATGVHGVQHGLRLPKGCRRCRAGLASQAERRRAAYPRTLQKKSAGRRLERIVPRQAGSASPVRWARHAPSQRCAVLPSAPYTGAIGPPSEFRLRAWHRPCAARGASDERPLRHRGA